MRLIPRGNSLTLEWGRLYACYLGSAIWDRRNYMGSEISRSQMCYLWSEILGRQDYLGSDISSISLSKPFS